MKMKIETIRRAVLKHHGGFGKATDAQIMTLWRSLPEEVQKKYLENTKERKAENAAGTGAGTHVQSSARKR